MLQSLLDFVLSLFKQPKKATIELQPIFEEQKPQTINQADIELLNA